MRRWLDRRSGTKPVRTDYHPDLDEALSLFEQSDWDSLTALTEAQTVNGAFSLLRALGTHTPLDLPFGSLPKAPRARGVIGAVLVGWAWRHRGFGRGDEVNEDSWPAFFDRLGQAISALLDAVRADQDDGVSIGYLIRAATGANEVGLLHEARDLFYLARHRPLEGGAFLLQALGRKWHGSHEEMDAVAERLASDDDLPPGKVGLWARALIERWVWDGHMSDDPATRFRSQMTFSLKETRDRILRLDDDYRRLASVWSPAETDPFADAFAHDNIGCAAVLSKQMATARPHVAALGNAPGEWPWCYTLGDVEKSWPSLLRRVRA
ncbi:hypothetical protein [Parvularcula dongshanensis]|uniref:DUF4034 domain-containing protein n=1 Tax=Parvularcula dongshanensis TaxID=1173995 RepID=A0A840I4C9_9PROT|nr:hypothetical protein [Parvularcula dongshanensis]MBB4659028.1 hypothetical protein [Parvularcula dongshanensis]